MKTRTATLLAGAAALTVVAAGLFDTAADPPDGATAEVLRRWYETNLDTIGLSVTSAAIELGAVIVFVTALVHLMGRHTFPATLTVASGTLVAVWIWLHGSTAMLPIVLADDRRQLDGVSDATILTLGQFGSLGETIGDLSAVPRGLFLLAVSAAALSGRLLPRWIAWFGVVIAAASLVCVIGPAWWIAPFGIAAMIGLFGFLVWTALAGVTLTVRGLRTRVPAEEVMQDR
ncbi:hypothetical protein AB0M20_12235 [Actinoplanes sp. NPDC051633]|uniref:hypothetical protein n=1 Tax=Actinoplanes sp. NPDC051633 TaxID=3155670 RepID=UPI00342B46E2